MTPKFWPETLRERVTELKGALLRNEIWLLQGGLIYFQQVEDTGIHIQSSASPKGGLALCLWTVWTITGWFQLAALVRWAALKLILFTAGLQNTAAL